MQGCLVYVIKLLERGDGDKRKKMCRLFGAVIGACEKIHWQLCVMALQKLKMSGTFAFVVMRIPIFHTTTS